MTLRAPAPFFYVRGDEDVRLRSRPARGFAFALFVAPAVLATGLLALAYGADAFFGPFVVNAGDGIPLVHVAYAAYAVVLALLAVYAWRRYATTEYAITDARIYARTGRLRTQVHFTTHDKITDVRYHRGILDRLFGVSNVTFATAGGNVRVTGVTDALDVKETAETERDAFIQRLLEEAGVPREAAAAVAAGQPVADALAEASEAPAAEGAGVEAGEEGAPPPPPPPEWTGPRPDYVKRGDNLVWFAKPHLIAAVAGVVPLGGFIGFLLVVGLTARPGLLVGALPLLVVVALGAVAWQAVQLSVTEYVVTDKRVYVRTGVVGTTVKQLTYEKITDLTYRQDLPGRVLGYGGLTVNTAGSTEAPVMMTGLTNALEVKEIVERARARALREENA